MLELAEQEATVGSYLRSWLQHSKTRVRAKTYEGYEGVVRLYAEPRIGHISLRDLAPLDLQGLYAELLGGPDSHLSGGPLLNRNLAPARRPSQAVGRGR